MAYTSTKQHGKTARVEKNDTAVDFTNGWNITFSNELADGSRQGQHWKETETGQGSWSGSFSGFLVLGNTEQKAVHDAIVAATPSTELTDMKFLLNGSTEGWNGTIHIESFEVSAPVNGIVAVTVNFQGDGAPTLSDSQ